MLKPMRIGLLTLLFTILIPVVVLAQNIPGLGNIQGPAGMQWLELPSMNPLVAEIIGKAIEQQSATAVGTCDANTYQLVIEDANTFHTGVLMVFINKQDLSPDTAKFFTKPLGIGEQLGLVLLKKQIPNLLEQINSQISEKLQQSTQLDGSASNVQSIKIISLEGPDVVSVNKQNDFSLRMRMYVSQSSNLVVPLALNLWLTDYSNKLAGAIFITIDADRDYWNSQISTMLSNRN